MQVIDYQEVEDGPTRRQQIKARGIECHHIGEVKNNLITPQWTSIDIDIYTYAKRDGMPMWLIEAGYFYPPDIVFYRSWIVDGRPADAAVIEIVACNAQIGSTIEDKNA